MKDKIQKLENILKIVEKNENQRAIQLVFLSVVFLGYRFDEVSAYFNIPYNKVQNAVTVMHVQLKRRKSFMAKMHKACRIYNVQQSLILAA